MQHPVILTLFGIAGDLSRNKLLPMIADLFLNKKLPPEFTLIGFGRRPWSESEFKAFLRESLHTLNSDDFEQFASRCRYFEGQLDSPESFTQLAKLISEIEHNVPHERIFYCSIAPEFYAPVSKLLAQSGLNTSHQDPQPRLLIEKPFGHDVKSAQALESQLAMSFKESQIYRIDHYLAKTSSKTILDFRFYHKKFEPIWNSNHIDRIEVTLDEALGIGTRAGYYDQAGVVRDMMQNHALALASLVLMRTPGEESPQATRHERAEALRQLKAIHWSLGQYESYTSEVNVAEHSQTATYAYIELQTSDPQWHGTPIVLTSGKKLAQKRSEVCVAFRSTSPIRSITFRLYPEPAVVIQGNEDHTTIRIQEQGDGYSAVLLDCIAGNQTFFVHDQEVKASWEIIQPILDALPTTPLKIYKDNSAEPV